MAEAAAVVRARSASAWAGGTPLFQDVCLDCRPGEWLLICGPSGAGKSSLLRAINGLCMPSCGWIETLGTRIPGRGSAEARATWRRSGTMLQELGLFESRSARANVELALQAAGHPRKQRRARAHEALSRVGLEAFGHRFPCELSVGQRQRVALARAVAARPRLLLLDEPTSALDCKTAEVVLNVLAKLKALGTAILMSSHRVGECEGLCDRIIEMQSGHIVRDEPCECVTITPLRDFPALEPAGQPVAVGG